MKKTFTIVFAFVLVSSTILTGCNRNSPAPSVSQQITGKWTISTAVSEITPVGANTQIQSTPFTAADYMNFKADGTITIVQTGTTYNGNWKITNNKLILTNTNYMDFPNGFELPVLTTTDLQLYYKITDAVGVTILKLNLKK